MIDSKIRPAIEKQVAIYLIRRHTGLTNGEIGKIFKMKAQAVSKAGIKIERLIKENIKIRHIVFLYCLILSFFRNIGATSAILQSWPRNGRMNLYIQFERSGRRIRESEAPISKELLPALVPFSGLVVIKKSWSC